MGELTAKLQRLKGGGDKPQSTQEDSALRKLQTEAKAAGATLASDGKGGLPFSLVLHVMRRDEYRCHRCGGQKDLSLHHKAHLDNPQSKWLKKKAQVENKNDPALLATICAPCHDAIHEEDRAEGGPEAT